MAENLSKLMTETKSQIQESLRIPEMINKSKKNITLPNSKSKNHIRLLRNHTNKKSGVKYLKC